MGKLRDEQIKKQIMVRCTKRIENGKYGFCKGTLFFVTDRRLRHDRREHTYSLVEIKPHIKICKNNRITGVPENLLERIASASVPLSSKIRNF